MTATIISGSVPPIAALYPPPLTIYKKSRRATFRRHLLRKYSQSQKRDQLVLGPLDDIIDEITSNIWSSPPSYDCDSSPLDCAHALQDPFTWNVTPLPLSRIPSNQPLTIRKNRKSLSSSSASIMDDRSFSFFHRSLEEADGGRPSQSSYSKGENLRLSLDAPDQYNSNSVTPFHVGIVQSDGFQSPPSVARESAARPETTKRRPSRLRLLTNNFPRLRRTGTGDTDSSTFETSELASVSATTSPTTHHGSDDCSDCREPSDEAVEAYIKRIARNGNKLGSVMRCIANRLPPSSEADEGQTSEPTRRPTTMPTTLRTAVRIFPQTKILTDEIQEVNIAVDIEGVLHNQRKLSDATLDIIFVIDNGYHVTKACLGKALEAVNGTLHHLERGDRVALYTTHCAHHSVTGNKPDLLYPLRPYSADSDETFRDLTSKIAHHGTQVWFPPRPNPSMTEVILAVARSVGYQDLKLHRTHIILLSPAGHVLHDISRYHPELLIHRINPAVLPFRGYPEWQDTVCHSECCKNVFVSNFTTYQSVPGRIARIIKNARSEKPVGELSQVSIDIRAKDGCEVLECAGDKDVSLLQLGEVHTIFLRVRITKDQTQAVNLASINPIFSSSLNVHDQKQQLQNVLAMDAVKVHVLDIQVFHQNSLHRSDCWTYCETPLFVIRELGRLAPPKCTAMEVYKRQCFRKLTQPEALEMDAEIESVLATLEDNDGLKKLLECMVKEVGCHVAIRKYEQEYRQKLPLCPGPIDIESSAHDWLMDLWNRKKLKRKGVAVVRDEEMTNLIDKIRFGNQLS
ncbi:hypothetical protein ACN47E_002133 [Coniothyrium glycines]